MKEKVVSQKRSHELYALLPRRKTRPFHFILVRQLIYMYIHIHLVFPQLQQQMETTITPKKNMVKQKTGDYHHHHRNTRSLSHGSAALVRETYDEAAAPRRLRDRHRGGHKARREVLRRALTPPTPPRLSWRWLNFRPTPSRLSNMSITTLY